MEIRLGLTPEEMMSVFNRMYQDAWERKRGRVAWDASQLSRRLAAGENVDLEPFLLQVLEVVVEAARDGVVAVVCENNQQVVEDLQRAGIELPEPEDIPPVD